MMSWRVILILAVILSSVLVTLGWCIILIIPAILGWALILSWLLDGAMWVRRKLHTAEEELDGLDQPEESGNQVNVTFVTADGVNEHVVPELVLSTPVSAGKLDFRNFMAPTLTDFDDMVQAAFTVLPKKYTHLCDAVMIQVKDFPDQETLEKVHSKNKFGVLGTFHKLVRSSRVCLAGADPTGWAGPSSPCLENGERLVAFSHCCRAFRGRGQKCRRLV